MPSENNLEQQSLPLLSKATGEAILKTTPMFQQFMKVKAENDDCLLFFRMGDFYELFFEDAVIASNELDIALTSRGQYDGKPVPMCGVPYHSYMPYLEKLTKKKIYSIPFWINENIWYPIDDKKIIREKYNIDLNAYSISGFANSKFGISNKELCFNISGATPTFVDIIGVFVSAHSNIA